jgi:predicted DNA-binding transcriptional regulator AlpA
MSRNISANSLNAVQNFDSLPPSALINFGALQILVGKSRPTIYRWIKAGFLPKPAQGIAGVANSWCVGDVRQALTNLAGGAE